MVLTLPPIQLEVISTPYIHSIRNKLYSVSLDCNSHVTYWSNDIHTLTIVTETCQLIPYITSSNCDTAPMKILH